MFQDPLPAEDQIPSFYPPAYSAYGSRSVINLLFRFVYWLDARRVRSLLGNTGRILDVGCGDGSALVQLREAGGWQLFGLEVNPAAADKARRMGLEIQTGELLTCTFPAGSFDLIRMGHVIEHVLDPIATLQRAFELLRPGGLLFGETPNTDCLDFRVFGRYWGALHIPRHIVFFNNLNLGEALKRSGFSDVQIFPRLRTVGWSAGIQNVLADRFGLRIPSSGRVRWYLLLILTFLPMTAIQAVAGHTATVAFYARKPGAPASCK